MANPPALHPPRANSNRPPRRPRWAGRGGAVLPVRRGGRGRAAPCSAASWRRSTTTTRAASAAGVRGRGPLGGSGTPSGGSVFPHGAPLPLTALPAARGSRARRPQGGQARLRGPGPPQGPLRVSSGPPQSPLTAPSRRRCGVRGPEGASQPSQARQAALFVRGVPFFVVF